jgi:hypothetical protein
MRLETIAYEEAGHAVACCLLHVPFVDVMISPLRGEVRSKGDRPFEEKYFIVSVAGPVARLRFDPGSAWADLRPGSDIPTVRAAIEIWQREYGSWNDFDDVKAKAEQLIEAHWQEVECVVQALLKSRWLSAEEVCRIVRNGVSPATPPRLH